MQVVANSVAGPGYRTKNVLLLDEYGSILQEILMTIPHSNSLLPPFVYLPGFMARTVSGIRWEEASFPSTA